MATVVAPSAAVAVATHWNWCFCYPFVDFSLEWRSCQHCLVKRRGLVGVSSKDIGIWKIVLVVRRCWGHWIAEPWIG